MTEGKDLLGPLREADREMSRATLAPRARKRIAARLDEASEAPTARDHGKRRALLAVTAAAATFAALAVWRGHREAGDGQRAAASGRLAGFAWQGDQCSALPRAGALLLDGTCRADLDELGVVITSRGAAQLVRV